MFAELYNVTNASALKIIRRSAELDAALTRAGFDCHQINKVDTPLIGACKSMSAKVLIAGGQGMEATGYDNFGFNGGVNDRSDTYELSIKEFEGQTVPTNASVITPLGSVKPMPSLNRIMKWVGLTCISITQLHISAGSSNQQIAARPYETFHPSLWVMEFVDQRYFLNKQLMTSLSNASNGQYGTSLDRWNMLAENPLHLIKSTCKYYEPNPTYNIEDSNLTEIEPDWGKNFTDSQGTAGGTFTFTGATPAPIIDPKLFKGIPATQQWYYDDVYTATEILDSIFYSWLTANRASWGDKNNIQLNYANAYTYEPKSTFDLINLDLRAFTFAEALDEIAKRIGCVWVWDRTANLLILTDTDPYERQNQVYAWKTENEVYRSAGGLNTLGVDMPVSVVTVHPTALVSTYGFIPDPSGSTDLDSTRIIQDYRTMPNINGVQDFLPTQSLYYLNTTQRNSYTSARTVYLGDHMPAFFGCVSADVFAWSQNIPAIEDSVILQEAWNYDSLKSDMAVWFTKPWCETLIERNFALTTRYSRLKNIVSGDLTMSRIPAMSYTTPSLGLQNDSISFGNEDANPALYRIYGDKDNDLLLPARSLVEKVAALGLNRCRNVSGVLNIEYLKPRAGIVRTFLCSFKVDSVLRSVNGSAICWLYSFREVQLSNLPFPKFQQDNEHNEGSGSGAGASGYCMNLCELTANNITPPIRNFDGGSLNYAGVSIKEKIVMTPVGGQADPLLTLDKSFGGYAPCYEIVNEGGATFYWIYALNGVSINCATISPFTITPSANSEWLQSGVSGIGFVNTDELISGTMST